MGYDFEKLIAEAQPQPFPGWQDISEYDGEAYVLFKSEHEQQVFGSMLNGRWMAIFDGEATPLGFEPVQFWQVPAERVDDYMQV